MDLYSFKKEIQNISSKSNKKRKENNNVIDIKTEYKVSASESKRCYKDSKIFRIKNLEKWDKILKDAKIWIYSLKFKIIFFILHRISPNIILYNITNIL